MSSEEVDPFTLSIPQSELDRLHSKLKDTRNPTKDVVHGAGKDYGLPTRWAVDLYDHWLNDFSWTKAQAHINTFPQYTTSIEDLAIHFIHQPSPNPNAIPLLLIHGWPGSFYEFSSIIPLLTNPTDSSQQAFHCIGPSLPGFTFSTPPSHRGWTVKDTARLFHTLMLRLGYSKYMVQAGDWGQFPARELGAQYTETCKLIHLNWCPGSLPEDLAESDLTAREKQCRDKGLNWRTQHIGYAVLMRTRPQTLGWMLQDNPAGLLAFVGEKYEEASNPCSQLTREWKDHVLTTICLYYFTNCIMGSALVYYENAPHDQFAEYVMAEENRIQCPFGYTSCLYDTAPNSKRAVERTGNLVWYRERDETGHFACLEDPEGMAEDVRDIVAKHWPSS